MLINLINHQAQKRQGICNIAQNSCEEIDDGELIQDSYNKKLTRERIMNKIDKW